MRFTPPSIASLLGSACLLGSPPSTPPPAAVSRRAALTTAAGLAAVSLPAYADGDPMAIFEGPDMDDGWTKHEGPFDDAFFKDFTVSKAESSFKYKFIKEGDGGPKPVPFQKVSVNYRGYLLDGTLVDSSYGRKKPFTFRLGKGKVIRGWEAIVPGMTKGMRVIVRVPSEYAYGDKKIGKIPPNSPLVFYMELVELLDVDKKEGIVEELAKG